MSSTVATTGNNSDQLRLPTNVKPLHYDVTIRTDLEKLEFEGFVKISLDVKEDTTTIVLSSDDLVLGESSIYSQTLQKAVVQSNRACDDKTKRTTFTLGETLPAGSKADLKIAFKAPLGSSMTGYYRSAWQPNGETKHYALTQFEPVDARRAFPCWDEPALKATFAITLISRADTVNLSNMPVESEEVIEAGKSYGADTDAVLASLANSEEKWKISNFQTSPLMSTYLVAFANGPFEYLETSVVMPLSGKTIPLRIYTTSDLIGQAQFALDVKAKVLPLYEQVFEVEFPLPKLDTLVATDFDAGAMENWGLITGRTVAFLLDPKSASVRAKKTVVTIQSHEVAHMWFGNITTMAWWDYLYLNEGFATLMGEVIIPNKVYPEFKANTEFINDHLQSALSLDAKLSSHPIEVACPDADQIGQIFDSLSYAKAGSVLRMLANHVGEDRFLKGVSIYLKAHLFANSVTGDLWKGIAESTGTDIPKLMDNWITKIGFPVLTVTETSTGIHVRQDRFLETGLSKPEDNTTIWNIPLGIVSVDENGQAVVDNSAVLVEREQDFKLDTSKPYKLNSGTFGVYRVLYTPERLSKIAAEAAREGSSFTLDDRIGLLYDTFALLKAGLVQVSSALDLVETLRNEKEYLVWSGISDNLGGLSSIWWEYPEINEGLDAFRRSLFAPLVERLGYEYSESEDIDDKQLRTLAISQSAGAGDKAVVAELKRRFDHFLETGDDSLILPDLQGPIFKVAIKYGGPEHYDALVKIHQKPKTPMAGIAARAALGMAEDPALLEKTFQIIKTDTRDQDVISFFRGFIGNYKARRAVAEFTKKEYDALYKRYEKNFSLKYFVEYSFSPLSTEKDYEETAAFFKDKDTSKYHLSLGQALDSIRGRIGYIAKSTEDLSGWLKGRKE